jgi:hypothetical protein
MDSITKVIQALNVIRPNNKLFIVKMSGATYLLFNHCVDMVGFNKVNIPCWSYAQIMNNIPRPKSELIKIVQNSPPVRKAPYFIMAGITDDSDNKLVFLRKDSSGNIFKGRDALEVDDLSPDIRALRTNYDEYQRILSQTPTDKVFLSDEDLNTISDASARYTKMLVDNLKIMDSSRRIMLGGKNIEDTSEVESLGDLVSDINDELENTGPDDLGAFDIPLEPEELSEDAVDNLFHSVGGMDTLQNLIRDFKPTDLCNEPYSEYSNGFSEKLSLDDIE